MIKLRQILAVIVAPCPVVALLILIALWVRSLPIEVIEGTIDNASYRAASLRLFIIPFLFYPVMVFFITLQTLVIRRMHGLRLKSHLIASLAISAVISPIIARAIYAPQFGESYLRAWTNSFLVMSVLAIMTTLTWWFVAAWSPGKSSTAIDPVGL